MTHKWKYRFTVCGQGQFPIDMLRYDSCHPEDEHDSDQIQKTFLDDIKLRFVTLVRYGDARSDADNIEPRRWESFGWQLARHAENTVTRL